ncbi:MAG: ChbG/HpnK family deacetylase [Pusillimonas sp.]|nr:ChbG/HpnK family deacetylase [Pusillimonas sp.]
MEKNKTLILCADDFGMNSAANAAILALAQCERLSATSCLVDGPTFERDAALLQATQLQTGLHLNFTDNFGQPDLVMPINQLIAAAYSCRLKTFVVKSAVARQFDRYETIMGRAPDYVDGHLHVHQLPVIRNALLAEMVSRYGRRSTRPWLRNTRFRRVRGLSASLKLKAWIIQTLGSAALVRLAKQNGFQTNGGFLGVYGFTGGESAYAKHMQAWLGAATNGDVLMCHPECGDVAANPQRCAEYRVLKGDDFGMWLVANSVHLQ